MDVTLDFRSRLLESLREQRNKIMDEIAIVASEINALEAGSQNRAKQLSNSNFRIVKDFNFTIGPFITDEDHKLFNGEHIDHFISSITIYDLLVHAGLFTSKNEARKNWKGITTIPSGWTEISSIGKGKVSFFIFNPSN
jgi:hypothetical protein